MPKYGTDGYNKFLDPDGYPAIEPPWGTLNAINLDTGEIAWKIPLGEFPELAAKGMRNTGSENYGGAGGDRRRAVVHRGHELRPQVSRVRQDHREAVVGDDAARGRQRHAGNV